MTRTDTARITDFLDRHVGQPASAGRHPEQSPIIDAASGDSTRQKQIARIADILRRHLEESQRCKCEMRVLMTNLEGNIGRVPTGWLEFRVLIYNPASAERLRPDKKKLILPVDAEVRDG